MTEKLSDQWQTPQWLFEELNEEFNFDIDLCATRENSKCYAYGTDYLHDEFMTKKNDLCSFSGYKLGVDWAKDSTCFMNPPYSNPKPFIEKAWEDSKHCKIVCLVKCDPSTKWWATFWDYGVLKCKYCGHYDSDGTHKEDQCPLNPGCEFIHYYGPKSGCEVRFFPKRIKFDPPQQLIDSGTVWREGNKWVERCEGCDCDGIIFTPGAVCIEQGALCTCCKGKGYKILSGPTFASALIIMDRRSV